MAQFAEALSTVATPSKPIDQLPHLKGRQAQINTVQQAIYTPGQHVFIFGERGVGKTSLAKTAGRAVTENANFRQLGCSSDSTFELLMRQIIQAFAPQRLASVQQKRDLGFNKLITVGSSRQEVYSAQDDMSVSWVADVLASLDDDGRNTLRVVLIDEMENLPSKEILRQFAELVKLLGDRGARITFIFTGVGADLDAILGYHLSSFRQFAQVKLERIDYQAALDIVDDILLRFEFDWEQEPIRTARFRIASIANGFPYYIHLVTAKLLFAVFNDKEATDITLEHLRLGITAAVEEAQQEIRKPYDLATRGRNGLYKLAAWAAADAWDLERTTTQIYQSYSGLCERQGTVPVTQKQLLQALSAMKRTSYGPLLTKGFRHGLYQFCENIIRGYVRLCASAEGVELQDLSPRDTSAVTHATIRHKRYIDPRTLGGPPTTLRR
jgi:energy-coupling factor transporter ATP-binding protein EcfA2